MREATESVWQLRASLSVSALFYDRLHKTCSLCVWSSLFQTLRSTPTFLPALLSSAANLPLLFSFYSLTISLHISVHSLQHTCQHLWSNSRFHNFSFIFRTFFSANLSLYVSFVERKTTSPTATEGEKGDRTSTSIFSIFPESSLKFGVSKS